MESEGTCKSENVPAVESPKAQEGASPSSDANLQDHQASLPYVNTTSPLDEIEVSLSGVIDSSRRLSPEKTLAIGGAGSSSGQITGVEGLPTGRKNSWLNYLRRRISRFSQKSHDSRGSRGLAIAKVKNPDGRTSSNEDIWQDPIGGDVKAVDSPRKSKEKLGKISLSSGLQRRRSKSHENAVDRQELKKDGDQEFIIPDSVSLPRFQILQGSQFNDSLGSMGSGGGRKMPVYYDELYDDNSCDQLDSLESHGSIIRHLISQVRIGMDLTKIVLPTFILERRSLLEMWADFFAHPDFFVTIPDFKTPEERMKQVVRWYLSAFHAGRNSEVAKKPYNPIIGETFTCAWDVPGLPCAQASFTDTGPVKWATKSNLVFIAEQVSHHPPVSAFYAEHQAKNISVDGYIWTKSRFLGLSVAVHMVGQALVSLPTHGEEYKITFPSAYGRSILTVPWVEMGGKCEVTCEKTGYSATIEFLTKPFYGGKKNQVRASIHAPARTQPVHTIQGEWNGTMYSQNAAGHSELFIDTKHTPIIRKCVLPVDKQGPFESRRLWKDVTKCLKEKDVSQATSYKHKLEQRQREEAKERAEKHEKWKTKHFHEVGEHWVYKDPLPNRAQKK